MTTQKWTKTETALALFCVFLIGFVVTSEALAGELTFTFDPPTHRVPSPDYPEEGRPLKPEEIDHYNGVVRQKGSTEESTFTVPGDATSFTLPDLVAGDYCVKLSTTDTEGRTDGFSEEKCKNVPEGPLTAPNPPVLHGDEPLVYNVPADTWVVSHVSSYELDNWHMPPEGAFDRGAFDSNTAKEEPHGVWHSRYTPDVAPFPHEIVIDMGDIHTVIGFSQKPRPANEDGTSGNGTIKDYSFQLSTDGITWTQAAGGTFPDGDQLNKVSFPPMDGRYFKLVGLSEQNGGAWTTVDEIYIEAQTHDYISITGGGIS